MKKVLISLLILLMPLMIFADSQRLDFVLSIDEDYGIFIPEDALKLDRFVFEVTSESGEAELLRFSSIDVGSLSTEGNSTTLTMRYYGNLSRDYEVTITPEEGLGWSSGDTFIPINVSFEESLDKPEDIIVNTLSDGSVSIFIPANRSRSSVAVVDLILSWSGMPELTPGEVETSLLLELSAN